MRLNDKLSTDLEWDAHRTNKFSGTVKDGSPSSTYNSIVAYRIVNFVARLFRL